MGMQKILLCLDTDPQPSVFDSVVAIDAGVDHLLRYGGVTPDQVEGLVHGAMFTRGPNDVKNTAVFIGGSDVAAAEALLKHTTDCFFGPVSVSVLADPNGANTTAAAAVTIATRHEELGAGTPAVVVGDGPVGQRIATLLAKLGAEVRLVSETLERSKMLCEQLGQQAAPGKLVPAGADQPMEANLAGATIVITAGPAGVEVVSAGALAACDSIRVAIDLNVVPPTGIGGVEVTDKAIERGGQIHYGSLSVGSLKMKIHKAAIKQLFTANNVLLGAEEVFGLAQEL